MLKMKAEKRIIKLYFSFIVIIIFLVGCESSSKIKDKTKILNAIKEIADNNISTTVPGIQISVKHTEYGLFNVTAGKSDIEADTDLSIEDNLRIASATKIFTATLIWRLRTINLPRSDQTGGISTSRNSASKFRYRAMDINMLVKERQFPERSSNVWRAVLVVFS